MVGTAKQILFLIGLRCEKAMCSFYIILDFFWKFELVKKCFENKRIFGQFLQNDVTKFGRGFLFQAQKQYTKLQNSFVCTAATYISYFEDSRQWTFSSAVNCLTWFRTVFGCWIWGATTEIPTVDHGTISTSSHLSGQWKPAMVVRF